MVVGAATPNRSCGRPSKLFLLEHPMKKEANSFFVETIGLMIVIGQYGEGDMPAEISINPEQTDLLIKWVREAKDFVENNDAR